MTAPTDQSAQGVSTEHTDGRMTWHVRKDGSLIYIIGNVLDGPHAQGDIYINATDLRRIAACWNACIDVETERLEEHPAPFSDLRQERDALAVRVRKLEAERDAITELNHTQWLALENVRHLAARNRNEEWAQHMLRWCTEAGNAARILRAALTTPERKP